MVTYEEALKESLAYFNGDDLAAQVFLKKYALQTPEGVYMEKTPEDMHRRLAKEFARIEAKYENPLSEEKIYSYLKNFKYIVPQGSPMAGVGNPYQVMSLSNCFVIESPYDSYGGICKTDQEQAQLMKRRGGVGFDISSIRPKGLLTANAAKTTDGIGLFMERYSNTCREVAQGGRRGALMLTISVHHPEIRTFVNIKRDLGKVTGANISVRLSDEFMQAVKDDKDVELRWPVEEKKNPSVKGRVNARQLWHEIIESAHASAEPGLLFWDTVRNWSPADAYEKLGFGTTSTNPCGEITLSPYDSCRLLLVNVVSFVKEPFTSKAEIDWKLFAEVVQAAQKMMDDIVDLELECIDKILDKIEKDPEPDDVKALEKALWNKIKQSAADGRRTGLGVTAIGDALAALNIRYGSDESVKMVNEIYKNLAINSYRSSVRMAKERGAFPVYDYELERNHPFINRIMDEDKELRKMWEKYGRRNIANTTTAPAGSVSVLTQTTSGIEPAFLLSYTRRRKINPDDVDARVDFVDDLGDKWQEYKVYHHGFKKWMEVTGKSNPEESPYHGATSNDINWVNKVRAQAAAQKWICHSISNCVSADTSIMTNQGLYKIEELAQHAKVKKFAPIKQDELYSRNKNGLVAKITEAYNNGVEQTLRIQCVGGYEIQCTPRHQLVTLNLNGDRIWKRADELSPGDIVVGQKGHQLWNSKVGEQTLEELNGSKFNFVKNMQHKSIKFPKKMSKKLARLLGYMCSDGFVTKTGIGLSQSRNNVSEDFQNLIADLFVLQTTVTKDKRSKTLHSYRVNSKELSQFFQWLGITKHDKIEVPRVVRLAGKSHVKEFIKGLTLDGHVTKDNLCVATSISKPMLQQVQMLLLNMGIVANLIKTHNGGKVTFPSGNVSNTQPAWSLYISDSAEAARFLRAVGFAETDKTNKAKTLFKKSSRLKLKGEVPDFEFRKKFRQGPLKKLKSNSLYEKFQSLSHPSKDGMKLSRETLLEMADVGLKLPEEFISQNWIFWTIKSVEDAGMVQTYDLSVPNGNAYLANGFTSHNTTNVPEDTTIETIKNIYMTGWETGCKGVTVYRDKSRSGVLVSSSSTSREKKNFSENHAPKRPKVLPCDIYHVQVKGEKWNFFVGLYEDKPYEIFAGRAKHIHLPRSRKNGVIKKNGHYNLYTGDGENELKIEDLATVFENPTESAFTRTVSLSLRHGVPIQYLVEQIEKGADKENDMFSLSKGLMRILKRYIKDGTKPSTKKCPECGSAELAYQEGCLTCKSCGYSKCG